MNQNLTANEKEFLNKAKYIRRFFSSEYGVATTPLKDLLLFYERMIELYEKANDESNAQECRALYLDFSETDMYFQISEEYLENANDQHNSLSCQLVRIHYNLMEAYLDRRETEKAMEHKRKLDEYVDE